MNWGSKNRARAAGTALGIGVILLASTSRAGLLQPGSRSGSISVAGSGENSGVGSPSPISETLNIPGTGDGNVTGSVWSNGFGDGFGSPAQNTTAGIAASAINLNQVSGDSYSLSADSSFGFIQTGRSGQSYISTSYAFDQQVVIPQPVQFTLQMSVTRPASGTYYLNGSTSVNLPVPTETFSGPGISPLSVSAPYSFPPFDVQPMSVSQTFTGTLQPGTYDFDSSWSLPTISYGAGNASDNETASVSATLSVTSVPEPTSSILCLTVGGVLALRRKKKHRPGFPCGMNPVAHSM